MSATTIITNATNGTIYRVSEFHRQGMPHRLPVILALLALAFIVSGLYLMFRREKLKQDPNSSATPGSPRA